VKEKEKFANKNNEGGFINKKKKAFTLIELLAIIVILAIIAVITVPIILNIIDNSKKGAATDSAYGYKDAVNKAYIQELAKPNNENLKLDGTYVVQSNGTLNADTGSNFGVTGYTNLPVSVSGDKPSSGSLTYSNNVLTSGCLVIGDYAVTFDGNETSTVKGDCSSNSGSSSNEQSNSGSSSGAQVDPYSMAAMCPGCKYSIGEAELGLGEPIDTNNLDKYYDNYDSLGNSFLGYTTDSSNIVTRLFACAIHNGVPYCIEGTLDGSTYNSNKNILNHFYNSNCKESNQDDEYAYVCYNEGVDPENPNTNPKASTSVGYNLTGWYGETYEGMECYLDDGSVYDENTNESIASIFGVCEE